MKSSLRTSPGHFLLHICTNDLASSKPSQEIANSITNLACQLKIESHKIRVPKIILKTEYKKIRIYIKKDVKSTLILKNCVKKRTFA